MSEHTRGDEKVPLEEVTTQEIIVAKVKGTLCLAAEPNLW